MAAAERQRRQAAQAAATLHAALAYLNRGGVCREPLAPGAFARNNPKAMQGALHLLYHSIRGAARAKKEMQHIYPVLEPAQAREFKALMQDWVRDLAAKGALLPDTAKYFVSAYQGSASHRAVLMLLDLSALALSKELGEGVQATLPDAELLPPGAACAGGGVPGQHAQAAATAAQQQLQARMDRVVATMQRLKQLHAQAAAGLAAGQGASAVATAQLAPRALHLFAGSQAATKRGDLVQELLSQGPPLTAHPEAVGPDSWADLLAAGKSSAPAAAPSVAVATPPAAARRLSNPAQEASAFAAEGLAANADALDVHHVLVQRLAAAGAAVQAASSSGASPGSAEVRNALAEAALYRESLVSSLQQELAAASVRAELQQEAQGGSSSRPALLQLLPPSLPPCNPVRDGTQAAQQAAATEPASSAATNSEWAAPAASSVQALRRSMWQQLQHGSSCGTSTEPADTNAGSPAALSPAAAAPPMSPASPPSAAGSGGEAAAGSSSSKAPRARQLAASVDSPNLAAMMARSDKGWADMPLLSQLSEGGMGSPMDEEEERQQRSWQPQQLGSPCGAESCASFSVGERDAHHSGSGSLGAAAAPGWPGGGSRQAQLPAASPMMSAAASFMPLRTQRPEPQASHGHAQASGGSQHRQASGSSTPQAATARAPSPPLALFEGLSPLAGSPAAARPAPRSGSLDGDSPAGSWRRAAAVAAAAAAEASPAAGAMSSGGPTRRAASVAFTLTPPKRLEDSPLPEQPPREQHRLAGLDSPVPSRMPAAVVADGTPMSRLLRGGSCDSPLQLDSPAQQQGQQPQVLQPLQQRQQASGSPGSPLLASCFKSKPSALAASPFAASPLLFDGQQQRRQQQQEEEQQDEQPGSPWVLSARSSPLPLCATPADQGSPASLRSSSVGRRRSRLITTSSPLGPAHSLDVTPPHRQPGSKLAVPSAAAPAGGRPAAAADAEDLLSGLKALDTPNSHITGRSKLATVGGGAATAESAPAGGAPAADDASALSSLRQRLARLGVKS